MLNVQKKPVSYLLLTIILLVIPNQSVFSITQINSAGPKEEVKSESLIILVKNISSIKKLRESIYKKSYNNIEKIEITKEAKLIKVTLTNEMVAKKLINYLKRKHNKYIKAIGYEKKILNAMQIKENLYQKPYSQLNPKYIHRNKYYHH
ncbi:hypothetical protein [Bacillus subtilis]|uniref:hypothetical protein n=1 Tax=Bacillus subtilis TaxID=1423 RepID=UPI00228116DD|nr:hypothetical protein [Bacillus subtilis]MCY8209507.1 hypothetical protein [Bacillus subtilis]